MWLAFVVSLSLVTVSRCSLSNITLLVYASHCENSETRQMLGRVTNATFMAQRVDFAKHFEGLVEWTDPTTIELLSNYEPNISELDHSWQLTISNAIHLFCDAREQAPLGGAAAVQAVAKQSQHIKSALILAGRHLCLTEHDFADALILWTEWREASLRLKRNGDLAGMFKARGRECVRLAKACPSELKFERSEESFVEMSLSVTPKEYIERLHKFANEPFTSKHWNLKIFDKMNYSIINTINTIRLHLATVKSVPELCRQADRFFSHAKRPHNSLSMRQYLAEPHPVFNFVPHLIFLTRHGDGHGRSSLIKRCSCSEDNLNEYMANGLQGRASCFRSPRWNSTSYLLTHDNALPIPLLRQPFEKAVKLTNEAHFEAELFMQRVDDDLIGVIGGVYLISDLKQSLSSSYFTQRIELFRDLSDYRPSTQNDITTRLIITHTIHCAQSRLRMHSTIAVNGDWIRVKLPAINTDYPGILFDCMCLCVDV